MFSHVMLGSNDIDRSKRFYDALFAVLGGKPGKIDPKGRLVYGHKNNLLMFTKPLDGRPATPGNGSTFGFAVEDEAMADAWQKAGVANGGEAIEDPPGVREGPGVQLYLAYLRDPDGNKLCALHRL